MPPPGLTRALSVYVYVCVCVESEEGGGGRRFLGFPQWSHALGLLKETREDARGGWSG